MSAASRRPPYSRRGEQAIAAFREAERYEATPVLAGTDAEYYRRQAEFNRARGEGLLKPDEALTIGAGGEAISSENKGDELFLGAHARIVDTLEHPNSVSSGASDARVSAALAAGVLESAIDAAQSAQAENSIERMLCHQLAAAHLSAMRLLEQSSGPNLQPGDVARFTNAAARMMDVYQAGCLTLLKLKTRGQQRVLVQYQQVNVGPGGQAVVAGRVGGSRKRGRGAKNGQ